MYKQNERLDSPHFKVQTTISQDILIPIVVAKPFDRNFRQLNKYSRIFNAKRLHRTHIKKYNFAIILLINDIIDLLLDHQSPSNTNHHLHPSSPPQHIQQLTSTPSSTYLYNGNPISFLLTSAISSPPIPLHSLRTFYYHRWIPHRRHRSNRRHRL